MKITALLHDCSADGEVGYSAACIEFPEANGQGESVEECLDDLRSAVHAVLGYRRQTAAELLGKEVAAQNGTGTLLAALSMEDGEELAFEIFRESAEIKAIPLFPVSCGEHAVTPEIVKELLG